MRKRLAVWMYTRSLKLDPEMALRVYVGLRARIVAGLAQESVLSAYRGDAAARASRQ